MVRGAFMAPPAALSYAGMYLLYADESGDLSDPHTNVFVVGGIAVHEEAVRPLAGEINATINRYLGRSVGIRVELHGAPMRVGAGRWKAVRASKRRGLYHAMMQKLCSWEHSESASKIEPFVVIIDRNHSQSPTETAYGELLYMFDQFLREGRREGRMHNGVLVADRSRYERTLEAWVELARTRFKRPRQDPRRLYALAETPFFVDSQSTRLMQLADLLAHAYFRAYNASDNTLAATVAQSLATVVPVRIVHFTSDSACACIACQSPPVAEAGVSTGEE
jgi:Protein of unknown function (DUF3800)